MNTPKLIVLALLLTSCGKEPQSVSRDPFKTVCIPQDPNTSQVKTFDVNGPVTQFASGISSEMTPCIEVTGVDLAGYVQEPYKHYVIYSVKLTNVRVGDIMWFGAYGEATMNYGLNTMIAWNMEISTAPATGSPYTIKQVSKGLGYNIDRNMHHGTFGNSDTLTFTEDYSEVYLNFVLNAATDACPIDSKCAVTIEENYGQLSGIILRTSEF